MIARIGAMLYSNLLILRKLNPTEVIIPSTDVYTNGGNVLLPPFVHPPTEGVQPPMVDVDHHPRTGDIYLVAHFELLNSAYLMS